MWWYSFIVHDYFHLNKAALYTCRLLSWVKYYPQRWVPMFYRWLDRSVMSGHGMKFSSVTSTDLCEKGHYGSGNNASSLWVFPVVGLFELAGQSYLTEDWTITVASNPLLIDHVKVVLSVKEVTVAPRKLQKHNGKLSWKWHIDHVSFFSSSIILLWCWKSWVWVTLLLLNLFCFEAIIQFILVKKTTRYNTNV